MNIETQIIYELIDAWWSGISPYQEQDAEHAEYTANQIYEEQPIEEDVILFRAVMENKNLKDKVHWAKIAEKLNQEFGDNPSTSEDESE